MALELSHVNSSLQLLKEELEELSCGADAAGRCAHTRGFVCACARTRAGPGVCTRVCVREAAIEDRRRVWVCEDVLRAGRGVPPVTGAAGRGLHGRWAQQGPASVCTCCFRF